MMTDFLIKEPDYITLHWNAGETGLVGVDSTAVMNECRDFELFGEAVSDADCVYNDDIGITLETTTGGDDDQAVIFPSDGADDRSLFREINWGPENETEFECVVRTEAIANADFIMIGLGLAVPATYDPAVDADQNLFVSEQGTDTNWTIDANVGNVDVAGYDTGRLIVADHTYHFRIAFDKDRIARFYIDGELVYTSQLPGTADAALMPLIGVEAGSANASGKLHVSKISMRRKWGVN
jgi:hypothetical protein